MDKEGSSPTNLSSSWVCELHEDMQRTLDPHRSRVITPILQAAIASGNYWEVKDIMTRPKNPEEVRDGLAGKYIRIAVERRFEVVRSWGKGEALRELDAISRAREVPLALRTKALLEAIPLLEKLACRDDVHLTVLSSFDKSDLDAATDEVRRAAAESLARVAQMRKSGPIDLKEMREKHREAVKGNAQDSSRKVPSGSQQIK